MLFRHAIGLPVVSSLLLQSYVMRSLLFFRKSLQARRKTACRNKQTKPYHWYRGAREKKIEKKIARRYRSVETHTGGRGGYTLKTTKKKFSRKSSRATSFGHPTNPAAFFFSSSKTLSGAPYRLTVLSFRRDSLLSGAMVLAFTYPCNDRR